MRIIVGLGNPGLTYRRTRHNIGYMVVKALAQQRDIRLRRGRFQCSQGEGAIGKEQVIVARPLTFMNASGVCVAGLVHHLDCSFDHLLVVCDDVNLDLGRIRLRRSGSAGGHKGLLSIIQHLPGESFPRLRVGIGRPPEGRDMMSYVLSAFRRREWPLVHETIARAAQAVETWVYHGIEEAMNRFNA
jgi:PTH1 family peptidyl-tRNA hydrolase